MIRLKALLPFAFFFFFFMPDPDVQQDKEWLQNRWLGHLMLA